MKLIIDSVRAVLEKTGTRFLFGHDYRQTLLEALSPMPTKDNELLSMFTLVANEMFFLPAWLDHHRAIGVERFYVLVDRSEDGTKEYLEKQHDVVIMTSRFRYGHEINISPFSKLGHSYRSRVGILYPRTITEYLFEGQWGLYLDADEFLILPPNKSNLRDLIASVDGRSESIPASNLVFFPRTLPESIKPNRPLTFKDLLDEAPFFDAEPLLDVQPGEMPQIIASTKTGKLRRELLGAPEGNNFKTPLMKHSKRNFRRGSHLSSVRPGSRHQLAVAHFVFTSNTIKKVERAKAWNSYALSSRNYHILESLVLKMKKNDHNLLVDCSEKFEDVGQLVRAGLIVWPT